MNSFLSELIENRILMVSFGINKIIIINYYYYYYYYYCCCYHNNVPCIYSLLNFCRRS